MSSAVAAPATWIISHGLLNVLPAITGGISAEALRKYRYEISATKTDSNATMDHVIQYATRPALRPITIVLASTLIQLSAAFNGFSSTSSAGFHL